MKINYHKLSELRID